MCYPSGGDQPTITDANLALGRIPPALIGGGIRLDAARARAGIEDLGKRLKRDLSAEQLAEGIIEIAHWNQGNRIRQMTIQRGIDLREFALLSFGGSGPAQSPAVMELLGMQACIVPLNPGNLSAFGLLAVELAITMHSAGVRYAVAGGFLAIAMLFVYRSFYGMRITAGLKEEAPREKEAPSTAHA